MNHPNSDQWMSFLYGEDDEQQRRGLEGHLRECAECGSRLKSLRDGMSALDEWRLPRPRAARSRPVLRWAAAAAVLLAMGIGIGRLSAGNAQTMRAALQREMDAKFAAANEDTRQLLAGVIKDIEQRRDGDASGLLVALKQTEARHNSDLARLRRDLDTVAVYADARLTQAQEQLYQLATSAQSSEAAQIDDP